MEKQRKKRNRTIGHPASAQVSSLNKDSFREAVLNGTVSHTDLEEIIKRF